LNASLVGAKIVKRPPEKRSAIPACFTKPQRRVNSGKVHAISAGI
jgi:hypothetical protein